MTDVIRNINSNSQVAGSGSKSTAKTVDDASSAKANSTAAAAAGNGNTTDQVDLTSSAQKIDQVISSLSAEPIADRQKIDEIKSALAEGRYEINSAAIADKLIEIDELLK